MQAETRAQIERLLALWRLEREEAARRFQAERRLLPLKERVARGLAARDLRLEETAAAPGGRLLLWLAAPPGELDDLRMSPGDPIRL